MESFYTVSHLASTLTSNLVWQHGHVLLKSRRCWGNFPQSNTSVNTRNIKKIWWNAGRKFERRYWRGMNVWKYGHRLLIEIVLLRLLDSKQEPLLRCVKQRCIDRQLASRWKLQTRPIHQELSWIEGFPVEPFGRWNFIHSWRLCGQDPSLRADL